MENAIKGLNDYPAKDGVSTTISPKTIVTGAPALDYNDIKLEFGTYAHVYEVHNIKNDTKARTMPLITLNRTKNKQGGYYFMSLVTGEKLPMKQWTVVPMPDEATAIVEAMATKQDQPLMENGPVFEWAPGRPIDDIPVEAARDERVNSIDDDDNILVAPVVPETESEVEEADTSDAAEEDEEEVSSDSIDTSTSYDPSTDDESSQDSITADTNDDIENSITIEDVEDDDV